MRHLAAAFLVVVALAGTVRAAETTLGKLDFPVTASPGARAHFLRGVLALHSFFYDEAMDEFRAATKEEPGFAMGYWGEAMSSNQPIWQGQDADTARKALAKIGDTAKLSPRERGFIDAVRLLFGPGNDKRARDAAYAAAMERLARDFPDDLEVQSFYALSLLGAISPKNPSLGQRMRAGAIALDVLARNPEHPGAAHYVIHAFDDADHAVIALPAARRYAQIAPAAHHARHMPAHIFVNLGMWDDAAAACESAWQASVDWVERRHHLITRRDYHSLEWLVMIYHQQGRLKKANEMLAIYAEAARKSGDPGLMASYVSVSGTFLDRQHRAASITDFIAGIGDAPTAAKAEGTEPGCHTPPTGGGTLGEKIARIRLPLSLARQRAFAAAARGDEAEARKQLALVAKQRDLLAGTPAYDVMVVDLGIGDILVAARVAAAKKSWPEAEARLREAVALDAKSFYRGAANPAGGALETELGETLLAAGKPKEAVAAFADALRLTPGDSLALLGAARAARATGDDRGATTFYKKLAAQWKNADPDLPDLEEVRAGAGKQ